MTLATPASAGGSRLRLFFAVVPDPLAREQLARDSLPLPLDQGARRVPHENFHMTLAFVGSVAASQLPVMLEIGAEQKQRAFSLTFDAYEYWPKSGVIVAAACRAPAELHSLRRRLHDELATRGWAIESERFRPHVTLARKVTQPPVLQAMSPLEWQVRDFCLMRSRTGGIQSAYTVVDTWPLLDDGEKP